MEIQLEQLVLFESDEMLFSSVKICISTEDVAYSDLAQIINPTFNGNLIFHLTDF